MNILLSNDDGYAAEGIQCLYETLKDIANVVIVAPSHERSATSQALTLHDPIRVDKINDYTFSCSGYPADSVLLGINSVLDYRPDLVISGINHGANLGQDIYYSGTVGAARQAVFQGISAIAVSTVMSSQDESKHFQTAANIIKDLITNKKEQLLSMPDCSLLNINVPNLCYTQVGDIKWTRPQMRQYTEEVVERLDQKGRQYYWIGGAPTEVDPHHTSDIHAVMNGNISFSFLNLLNFSSDVFNEWAAKITD